MPILIITPLFPPATGGAASCFGQISQTLAMRGEVDQVVVLTEKGPTDPGDFAGRERMTLLRLLPARIGLQETSRVGNLAAHAQTQFWFAFHLHELVRRFRIDLIHFHTRYGGRLFYRALSACPVPVIADLRDQLTATSKLVGVADRLLCCGEAVLSFARAGGYPPERTTLLPVPFRRPTVPDARRMNEVRSRFRLPVRFLLFVGDMTAAKGVYALLQAYRIARSKDPKLGLVLAGVNREGKRWERKVAEIPGAIYLGSVSPRDAITLMASAEFLVLPSQTEGLPRVVLEAEAVGTRAICPPGIPEFDRHLPEQVLPDLRPEAIALKIDQLRQIRPCHAYPFEDHDVDRVVARLEQVYRQSIRQHCRSGHLTGLTSRGEQ